MNVPPPAPPSGPATYDDGLGEYPPLDDKDVDCDNIRHRVRVTGPDPHRLDDDGDGIGCESYGPPPR